MWICHALRRKEDLVPIEQAGKPSSFPLQTAGPVFPFSEQDYLLICLCSINLCAAKAMCTLLRSEPARVTWLSKPFPRCFLHWGFLQFWHKNSAKFIANFDSSSSLCFVVETSRPVSVSHVLTWCAVKHSLWKELGLRTEHRASAVYLGTQRGSRRRELALLPQAVRWRTTARQRPVRHREERSKRLRGRWWLGVHVPKPASSLLMFEVLLCSEHPFHWLRRAGKGGALQWGRPVPLLKSHPTAGWGPGRNPV